jgi:tetratricopeptide (TPR) repeat protein
MVSQLYSETARRYCVDDLQGARLPGARLQKILDCLQSGRPVTPLSLGFLRKQGLELLYRLAIGELPYENFLELALVERSLRIETAIAAKCEAQAREAAKQAEEQARKSAIFAKMQAARQAKQAEEQARESAMFAKMQAARQAKERDPKYIAKIANQQLRYKYGLDDYIEPPCFDRLMDILRCVNAKQRLPQEDIVWLCSVGEKYFAEELRVAYHQLEAEFFISEFKRTGNLWNVVNASSHYRKCYYAQEADTLLATIRVDQQKSSKLKSALCTTHGGVMRDLKRWDEALRLGEKAHTLRPEDYRPCTLLGAVYMEIGNYSLGQEWYDKAIERGATLKIVDDEIRRIFFQADKDQQNKMKEFLLGFDPIRYQWVKQKIESRKARSPSWDHCKRPS